MNQPSPYPSPSQRQGFTLVEVLVSSAITLIVLSMLFSILLSAMTAWQAGTSRLQTNSDARLALDLIAQDLQSMVARQTTLDQQWLVSGEIAVPRVNIANEMNFTADLQSTWLTFFAPSLDRDPGQQGDIVAISYAVVYQDPLTSDANRAHPILGLYKTMISTRGTFLHALGNEDIISGFWENQALDAHVNDTEHEDHLNRDWTQRRGFLVPNVANMSIRWRARSTQDPSQILDLDASQVVRLSNSLSVDGTSIPYRLEFADVSLTLLTDEGMRQFRTLARGNQLDNARLQQLIREHGRVHTQRVKIEY